MIIVQCLLRSSSARVLTIQPVELERTMYCASELDLNRSLADLHAKAPVKSISVIYI